MKKVFVILVVAGAAVLVGCSSANVDRAKTVAGALIEQEQAAKAAEARKAAAERERIEAERKAAEEQATRDQAEREAREEARRKAAEPGPHGPQRRDAANAGGHAYYTAGEQPPIVARDNPAWGRTLWKAQNDSYNGAVMLLDPKYMADYKAGRIKRIVIAADPWGREVISAGKVSGAGKVVAPYHERPAVRWDGAMGQAWRPGPVFVVMFTGDPAVATNTVRTAVWLLDDPALRAERK